MTHTNHTIIEADSSVCFNIYTDAWIQCAYTNGATALHGIRDCLLHAAEIKEISIPHPNGVIGRHGNSIYMDDITPFVLMEMLLVRVFSPASEDDKLDIWEAGRFDIDAIDRYIQGCESCGISFDVFDKDHPFLQISTKQLREISAEKKPLGMIQPTIPAGHSLAFYNCESGINGESPETVQVLTPAEYTAALIRNQMFRTANGSGYVPSGSVMGEPPLFILTKGRNLFETLLLSMRVEPSTKIREKDRPMWEWDQYCESAPVMISEHRFGYLASTLNPVIYLHYGDTEDGLVRNVYLKKIVFDDKAKPQNYNEDFLQASTNYSVSIQQDKKEKCEKLVAAHMQICDKPWYSLASMCVDTPYKDNLFTSLEATRFIKALRDEGLIEKNQRFTCEIYGLSMVTSTYTSGAAQCKASVTVPEELLLDQDGRRKLAALVDAIQKSSRSLETSLENLNKAMRGREKNDSDKNMSQGFKTIPRLFLEDETDKAIKIGGYLDQLAEARGAELPDNIQKEIQEDALTAYNSVSVPIKHLVSKEESRPRFVQKKND